MGGAEKVLIDIVKSLISFGLDVYVLAFFNIGALSNKMHETCQVKTLFKSKFHYLLFRKIKLYRKFLINGFIREKGIKIAVGFIEGNPTALLSDIHKDIYKIAWIHSDIRKLDIDLTISEMEQIYKVVDKIIFVSNTAKNAFFEKLPRINAASQVIYNLTDEKKIKTLSDEEGIINKVFTFLNVGMLRKEKRQDRLIKIAASLKKLGFEFQIQIIGDGPRRAYLEKLIWDLDVADKVFLLGLKENPYPFIKRCDCFVLSSDFEGYGIVVKEALFLRRLVLITDIMGPKEILEDGQYGVIVENSEAALLSCMIDILSDQSKYNNVLSNIQSYSGDNDTIKNKLLKLFSHVS
jgi:glycosyltransferase involved in cell wall biosynthesis